MDQNEIIITLLLFACAGLSGWCLWLLGINDNGWKKAMKIKLYCKSMDAAAELHNALLDCVVEEEGRENSIMIGFGGYNDWYVTMESLPLKEKAPEFTEA